MPDAMDEQIRALVVRAVAQAPPPPPSTEIDAPRRATEGAPSPGGARGFFTAAAALAAVALAVVGALAVHDPDGEPSTTTDRDGTPFDANAVRFVPTVLPPGMQLSTVEDSVSAIVDRIPAPQVSVFDGPDGVRVRVVVDPFGSGTVGATATTGSLPPDTSSPTSTSTVPASPTSTAQPSSTGSSVTTQTTVAATGVPGLPVRPRMETTAVRGASGAVEVHDASATTVWFLHQGTVVAVDVFGLDSTAALRIANGLTPRAGGGFDPAPEEQLVSVAEADAGSANDPLPATTRLVYTTGDPADGSMFAVTTAGVEPGRRDLLTAAATAFGRIEHWGDREVLVAREAVGSPAVSAWFLTSAGELVTVYAPATADLRRYVDGVRAVDRRSWEELITEEGHRVADLPLRTSADVGGAIITEHRPNGAESTEEGRSPGGYCLEVDGATACRPGTPADLAPGGRTSAVHALLDGRWWYFGRLIGEATLLEVSPDRGGPAEIRQAESDGATWFAVRLPEAATSALVRLDGSSGEGSEAREARPAS